MNSLIKFEGKPIEKLIDVVSKTIGTIYEPRQIVRKAKAEAKAESIKAIEQAKTNAIIEGDLDKAEYLDGINNRLVNKETKRQKNIEDVVSIAVSFLEAEKEVSNEPVNSDWATRFFDIVQDISDNEMQLLWGKILAGEIKRPQSYSLRTLEILRNMTKEEAELFQKVAQFTITKQDQDVSFLLSSNNNLIKQWIPYCYIAKLIEIGLIQPSDNIRSNYSPNYTSNINKIFLIYGNIVVIIYQMPNASFFSFPVRLLTTSGKELARLISITPNVDYIKELASIIKQEGITVSYSKIVRIDENGSVQYSKPEIKL